MWISSIQNNSTYFLHILLGSEHGRCGQKREICTFGHRLENGLQHVVVNSQYIYIYIMFLYSICFIITYIIVLCCHNIVVINIKWWYVIMITWSCHNLVMLSPWFFMICTPFHQGTESPCAAATLTARKVGLRAHGSSTYNKWTPRILKTVELTVPKKTY